jgi:hypothetical protein
VGDETFHSSIRFVACYWVALFVIVAATLVALVWLAVRGRGQGRTETLFVLLFTAAGLGTAYPRFDVAHLLFAAPVLLVGAGYAVSRLTVDLAPRTRARGRVALALALAPATAVLILRPAALLVTGDEHIWTLPHFRVALLDRGEEDAARADGRAIARAADGRPLFLLSPIAGYQYLLSGAEDPTPFDFPVVTALGPDGERGLIGELEDGRIDRVCLGHWFESPNTPTRVIAYVRRRMNRVADVGPCELYVSVRAGPT